MYFNIEKATYVSEYKIEIIFEDGSTGVADLSNYPNQSTVFRSFLDQDYFRAFRIEYGTLVWGKGDVDIAPETLYTMATGKRIRYRPTHTTASP